MNEIVARLKKATIEKKPILVDAAEFEAVRSEVRRLRDKGRQWTPPLFVVKATITDTSEINTLRRFAMRANCTRIIAYVPKAIKRELIKDLVKNPARCWVQVMEVK